MPNLKTTDGDTLADGLTPAEISRLREMGVGVDLPDTDSGSGSGDESTDDRDTESDADGEPPSDAAETDGDTDDGSRPESAESASDASDADGESDAAAGDESGSDGHDARGSDGDGEIDPSRDLADEFADRDRDEMLEDEFEVDMDSVREPDRRDRARWANLLKQLSEYGKNIPRRKRERDERVGDEAVRKQASDIERELKNDGVISDLEDGFQQLVSRPTPRPARAGPRMDMNNVVRRASGDITVRELFEEDVQVETGDRCIGLATDISGSMGSDMVQLKKAGAAIAEATEIIGDAFVWEAFTDKGHGGLDLRIVTGPQESFKYEHLDSFTSMANEPTGAGIRDCRMLMERTAKYEYTMLVITDGKAMVGEDGEFYGSRSNVPVEHARQAVDECRERGIEVIGLGIGGMSDRKMTETFGEGNYKLTSIDELADDVIDLYSQMMDVERRR